MKNLYVGNLSFRVTEEQLRAEFESAGVKTKSVTLVREPYSGHPRGFGFVVISQNGDLEKAITTLNEKNLSGRAIVVNEARPKRDSGGGRVGFESVSTWARNGATCSG